MKELYIFVFLFIFSVSVVNAACSPSCESGYTCNSSNVCVKSDGSDASFGGVVSISNPLGKIDTVPALVGQIIKALLGISGSLALVMFIYGGFTWMTAAGNSEGIDKGKKIITWAVIGLIIIFSAYGLVKLVFSGLGVSV